MLGVSMATASVSSTYVEYEVDGKTYEAYVAWNTQQQGIRPGVLVFHEWWGLNDYAKQRARELANLGFVAFAADMFGKGISTTKAEEAGALAGAFYQDRTLFAKLARAAYDEMLKQPNVDAARTAAIGFCFGGTCALELARSEAELDGIVSFHGNLSNPTPETSKSIKCRVLVLHGADDPFVPAEQVDAFKKEMDEAKVDYKFVAYPFAVHAFTNPNADKAGLNGVAYNEEADKASMEEMRAFFRELFTEPK